MDTQPFETPPDLLTQEELLRASLDAVPAGIAMFDTNMRYIASSRYYREALGVGDRILNGRSHYEMFPDLPQAWIDVHRRVLAGETVSADDDAYPRGDGSVSYWHWEMRPWHRPDGTIGGAVLFNRDVTEAVTERARLRKLSDALDGAGFGICIVDAPGNTISYANSAFAALHGATPADMHGEPVLNCFPEPDRPHIRHYIEQADAEGQALFEATRLRRDGSSFPGFCSISTVKSGPGVRSYRVGTLLDITEGRKLQAALQAKDVLFRSYIENAPVCVLVANAEGAIIAFNPAAAAMLRGGADGLLGRQVSELHFPEDREAVLRDLAVLRQEGHLQREYRIRRLDGSGFAAILSAVLLPDGSSLGFMQDIDSLRAAEAAHRAAQDDLQAMIGMGPPVLLYRARAGADGTAVLNVHGDPAALLGGGTDEVAAVLRHKVTAKLLDSLKADPARADAVCELPHTGADGTARWVRNRVRVTGRCRDGLEVVGFLADSTRERQEQDRLQRVATLVTLGEMATGIAHELKQPLSSISFAAQNAAFQLQRPEPDLAAVAAKVEKIAAETQRASGLLEHMKIFGRNEHMPARPVPWKTALAGAMNILSSRLRYFAVRDAIPEGLPDVMGAPVLMEQVLINVIGNAMDAYEARHPGLPSSAREIAVTAELSGGSVVLRVADRAGGIPPEVIARVFEPFLTTKPSGQGTGLGLALCFGTITEMGGTLTVENAGGGAVFEIRVPAAA